MENEAVLNELRDAYWNRSMNKRLIRDRIKAKYEGVIYAETQEAIAEIEKEFLDMLKDYKQRYRLRVSDIQDHVLRTRTWTIWTTLRDKAGLEAER